MSTNSKRCKPARTFLLLLFALSSGSCQQNDKPKKAVNEMDSLMMSFSVQWKADSFGQNGFRMTQYSFDTISRSWLISELDFSRYDSAQIVRWLGPPNYSGRHKEDNGLIMKYPVRKNHIDHDIDLLIYFNHDDKVSAIMPAHGLSKK